MKSEHNCKNPEIIKTKIVFFLLKKNIIIIIVSFSYRTIFIYYNNYCVVFIFISVV